MENQILWFLMRQSDPMHPSARSGYTTWNVWKDAPETHQKPTVQSLLDSQKSFINKAIDMF